MSNESKHTPAPWFIHGTYQNKSGASYSRIDAHIEREGRYVANLVHVFGNDDESKATARLIVGAPEMYNKLKEISDALVSNRQHIPPSLLKALKGVHEIIDQIKTTQI